MSLTLDDSTSAANPGRVTIAVTKYIKYYRIKKWQKIALYVISILPGKIVHKTFRNSSLVYEWIQTNEHFKFGCINPCIVLDKDKGVVAAFTSLTAIGDIATPVIKIYKERLDLINNYPIFNGQKLATVALYVRDEDEFSTNWKDFLPLVPNCFSDNNAACKSALNSISKAAWWCLEEGLEQLTDKSKEGLYYVELDNALVKSAY